MLNNPKPPWRLLFYLGLLLLTTYVNLSLIRYAADDAYIHFRIAENLLNQGVPYYNTDDAMMSSSSSGWTILLFLLFHLTGVSVTAVSLFNSAATVACAYVFSVIIRELTGEERLLRDLFTAAVLIPAMLVSSIGLMETPFSLLVLAVGILLFIRGSALAFLVLGASVFFRPELAVFAAVLALLNVAYRRVGFWKMAAYSLAGAAPFLAYNYRFFGTNIPFTVDAKLKVYTLRMVDVVRVGVPHWIISGDIGSIIEFILTAVLCYLAMRLSLKSWRDYKGGVVAGMAAGGAAIFGAYMLKRVLVFEWYTPLYFVPIFAASLASAFLGRSKLLAAVLVLACIPFSVVAARTIYASAADRTAYPKFEYNASVPKQIEVGKRLYAKYPDYSLMSSEIGGLGFAFKGRIYDGVGLVSREALKYHPMKIPEERLSGFYGAVPAGFVREVSPDIIAGYEVYLRAVLNAEILDKYVLIKEDDYVRDDMAAASRAGMSPGKNLCVLIRKDRFTKGY